MPGLEAAVAGSLAVTSIADEGSVVGGNGKDGCLRIVPYCPMKEPSSSNRPRDIVDRAVTYETFGLDINFTVQCE